MNTIFVTKKNHVQTISLNRPDVHNAFNVDMIVELTQTFKAIKSSSDVRAVLLKGEGKSFCAGGDLNWMKSMVNFTFEENLKDSDQLFEMFDSIAKCPVPVIGHVHGSVFGGGVGLAAACDIVVASRETKFCFSEVKLGLVPSVISPFVMAKARPHLARQMMLTAQVFDEAIACDMGLVHFIGSEEEIEDFIQNQFDFVLAAGPEATSATKSLLDFVETNNWSDVRKETARVIADRRVSREGQEGVKSYFEKRKPSWRT